MKYLIISFRLFMKQKKAILILVLEMVLSILVLLGLVGKLQTINNTAFIKDAIINTNSFYIYSYPYVMSENKMPTEFYNKINSAKECKGVGIIRDLPTYIDNKFYPCIVYNDTIIENIKMPVSSGKWFDNGADTNNNNPVIFVGNKYKVGDIVNIMFENGIGSKVKKATVIATMPLNSQILSFANGGSVNNSSIGDISSKVNDIFIMPDYCLTENELNLSFEQSGKIMFFNPSVKSDDVYKDYESFGGITSVQRLSALHQEESKAFLIKNGIVFLIFSLLVLSGVGGQNGIQYIKNKKQFAIYYMLGMSTKKCAVLEAIRGIIIIGISYVASIVLFNIDAIKNIIVTDDITINYFTFAIVIAYLALIYFITSFSFVWKISKSNPIECYRNIK